MTMNDRKELNELMRNIEDLNRDLDIFLNKADDSKADPFLHDWVAYNDRRLNLLIRIVEVLTKGKKQDDII